MPRLAPNAEPAAVAVDGKAVRGGRHRDGTMTYLLAAAPHDHQAVRVERQVDAESNEIPALIPPLTDMEPTGKVVTADALHTQRQYTRLRSKTEAPARSRPLKATKRALHDQPETPALAQNRPT